MIIVCNAYPQAVTGQDGGLVNGCRSSDIQRCRNNIREFASKASGDAEKRFGYAFLCLFSEFARCAAKGVERAGSISTDREFQQATQRGLASCGFELSQ
ncbi:MAG: hypothetical protein ABEN55_11475 [Bradymonadaceae bacterium]